MHPIQTRILAGALVAGAVLVSSIAVAEEDISQLKQQLDELDQKIRVLQRVQEQDKEAAIARAKETPSVSAGKDGFYIKSGDGAFSLRLGAVVQADTRWNLDQSLSSRAAPDNI